MRFAGGCHSHPPSHPNHTNHPSHDRRPICQYVSKHWFKSFRPFCATNTTTGHKSICGNDGGHGGYRHGGRWQSTQLATDASTHASKSRNDARNDAQPHGATNDGTDGRKPRIPDEHDGQLTGDATIDAGQPRNGRGHARPRKHATVHASRHGSGLHASDDAAARPSNGVHQ